jgi:hypothetical protein
MRIPAGARLNMSDQLARKLSDYLPLTPEDKRVIRASLPRCVLSVGDRILSSKELSRAQSSFLAKEL